MSENKRQLCEKLLQAFYKLNMPQFENVGSGAVSQMMKACEESGVEVVQRRELLSQVSIPFKLEKMLWAFEEIMKQPDLDLQTLRIQKCPMSPDNWEFVAFRGKPVESKHG